jgi:hypothetical protein
VIAEICEKFGWTYNEYMEQPMWFLETIVEKLKQENEVMRIKQREAEKKNNYG